MAYISAYQYYTNGGVTPTDENHGDYQYVTLADIVNNFILYYVGQDKQIEKAARHEVLWHAKQGIKKLNFSCNPIKAIELEVGDNLKFILPNDYVNWVRISISEGGRLYSLQENKQANTALGYLQDNNLEILFDQNGEILIGDSDLDLSRLSQSTYTGPGIYNGCEGWCIDGNWIFSRYLGSNPSDLIAGPTFRVNPGVIDFSSDIAGHRVVLEYVSDGMNGGDNTQIVVHKFAEEFIYRFIKWSIMNAKRGVAQYEKNAAMKEKNAAYNNASIMIKGIHPSRLLMTLKGQGKWIK